MSSILGVFRDLTPIELAEEVFRACSKNNVNALQYLLTSPNLMNNAIIHQENTKKVHEEIFNNADGFLNACRLGHMDVIKYLVESPDLKQHANVNFANDEPLVLAFLTSNKTLISYLMQKGAKIENRKEDIFSMLFEFKNKEMLQYLILDIGIEKTESISKLIEEDIDLQRIFLTRDLQDATEKNKGKDFDNKIVHKAKI